jgi:recombination protein RecA
MSSELDNTIRDLNKRFGKNTIISGDELAGIEVQRVSTGSLSLDIETGGGFPYGRLVELYGRESTGKSFMALKTAAEVQKQGKQVVWIDVEGSFDSVWSSLLGVNVKELKLCRPETGEIAGDILDAVIRSGECGLVVLDSTAALVPSKDLETAMEDVEQLGTRAKMVNRLIRKLHAALNMKIGEDKILNDCLVIFINQIREKIGVMYGSPDTTPGGLGLRHAASIRVEFRKSWIKDEADKTHVLGQTVTFVTSKNKTYPPYRRGEFDLYTEGSEKGKIDTTKEVFCYGLLSGSIQQTGVSYLIGKEKFVGKEKAIQYLRDNPKLVVECKNKILNHYKGGSNEKETKESKKD